MDEEPPIKALKAVLETIQERAKYALDRLRTFEEPKSLAWQCSKCGHTKKFTRKVPVEAALPCPKCGKGEFRIP
jgi:rubrerythrin